MTLTPCKGRTRPHVAQRTPSALAFYAKILPCAAGASVECMALAVVHHMAMRIQTSLMECAAHQNWK